MDLENILIELTYDEIIGSRKVGFDNMSFDSRNVDVNSIFFAIRGWTQDGHDYIDQVIENGCKILVVDREVSLVKDCTIVRVPCTSTALSHVASIFYQNPSKKISLVGITGTNGKTTTATLLYDLFSQMGITCGLISTVENRIGKKIVPSTHTTPNPIQLNALLSQMLNEGCEYAFMEVSSHAIHQKRTKHLNFEGAILTNITHDHLDYHKTFKEYLNVKKELFDDLSKSAFALSNIDDKNGHFILQNCSAKKYSYALKTPADYKAKIIENNLDGLVLKINGKDLFTRLIGSFNAYNVLAVYTASMLLKINELDVLRGLSCLKSAEGRFDHFQGSNGVTVIVDYAHTPDALKNVLKTIQSIRPSDSKVRTVIGCGGDRDKTKRPEMAKIAYGHSDAVVFTSDNPRTEDPHQIIQEMLAGLSEDQQIDAFVNQDRLQAIKMAISFSRAKDIVLIAGKGHEKYQEINGVRHQFDDMAITKRILKIKQEL